MKFVTDVLDELLYLTLAACAWRGGGIQHMLSLKHVLAWQHCSSPAPWVGGPSRGLWVVAQAGPSLAPCYEAKQGGHY